MAGLGRLPPHDDASPLSTHTCLWRFSGPLTGDHALGAQPRRMRSNHRSATHRKPSLTTHGSGLIGARFFDRSPMCSQAFDVPSPCNVGAHVRASPVWRSKQLS